MMITMNVAARSCIAATYVQSKVRGAFRLSRLLFSTKETRSADQLNWQKRTKKPVASWEERLADAVTPLWRLGYEEQLTRKQRRQERILSELDAYLSLSPIRGKLRFPLMPILPSPVKDGYRNKSNFSVNRGLDGNPKTVGLYVGTFREQNVVCVNADHLLNMPEKHKLVARCYQDFLRLSPLEPCLHFSSGHWRDVMVRTNAKGHTMVIVTFHPQTLAPAEVAAHKAELVDYFTRGPGSVCQLDSLFFQESTMTRCSHQESPYELLHGQPHIYEEVLGFQFRISADAFFQVNQAAAEVLYGLVRDLCLSISQRGDGGQKSTGTLLDVCCGTGAIGIIASPSVDRVVGVELIQQAVEDAKHNAALNNVLNCDFIPGKAEEVLPDLMTRLGSAGGGLTAVVNPARAGLHPRVIRALRKQTAIRKLVYVSCQPEGQAMRNFRELCCDPSQKLEGGAFSPTLAVPVDMFPHTPHCELVILFER